MTRALTLHIYKNALLSERALLKRAGSKMTEGPQMFDNTAGSALVLVAAASMLVFVGYCWARICTKAGFPAWWGILMMVPGPNVIPFLYLAFGAWPVHAARLNESAAARFKQTPR